MNILTEIGVQVSCLGLREDLFLYEYNNEMFGDRVPKSITFHILQDFRLHT